MKDLEKLSLKIDSCFPKLGTAEFILTLAQLGINTEGKPDIISSKRKLIRWIQKAYEHLMEDVDKQPEERKTAFQNLPVFVENFKGHDNGKGHDTNSREQQENNARTNQQEQQKPQDVIYGNRTAQQQLQQNQYEVGKTDTGTLAVATGMPYMPSIIELGYLNQKSLLRKDFKIEGLFSNAGQNDWLSFLVCYTK